MKEMPARFHDVMDTRRWGPGERLVFEPCHREVFEGSFGLIAARNPFPKADGKRQLRAVGHDAGAE